MFIPHLRIVLGRASGKQVKLLHQPAFAHGYQFAHSCFNAYFSHQFVLAASGKRIDLHCLLMAGASEFVSLGIVCVHLKCENCDLAYEGQAVTTNVFRELFWGWHIDK